MAKYAPRTPFRGPGKAGSINKTEALVMVLPVFDKKKLARDTLAALAQFGAGRKFVGHDGREYIVRGGEKPASETFIDVAVNIDGVDTAVARYAMVLIRISGQ